ncbi:MAG: glycoside hydrolase 43 family protein [Lachnospiraceae bacterium]|nr:glycoside hydrolase 43 family protein [Lachnospiraceae bacterium]
MEDGNRKFKRIGIAAAFVLGIGCLFLACNNKQEGENEATLTPEPVSVTPEQKEEPEATPTAEPETPTAAPTQTKIEKPAVVSYPTLYSDIPDPDIIRVGDTYYMTSTTMNLCPGVPVMKSKDLVHWQIVNYVYDVLENDDYGNLENGQDMYARGSWAASLRYDEASGLFYVGFTSNNHGFYIYTTDDIENGTWKKYKANVGFHDPGLFFEEGNMYVLSASGGSCSIQQLRLDEENGTVAQVGASRRIFSATGWSLWEGAHVYKVGEYYYVCIIASPADRWMRTQLCYRSDDLLTGEWEEKIIYQGGSGGVSAGLAQGGLVQTQFGDWYGFLFQDRGGIGRVPSIVAVEWQDGWPMMGTYSLNGKFLANETMAMRIALEDSGESSYFAGDDTFDYAEEEALKPVWQWNHNPANNYWSVTQRPGYLRLTTDRVVGNIYEAHNSLTQRTVGPKCETETKISVTGLKSGDYAGICAVSDQYGMIGILCDENGDKYVYQADGSFKSAFDAVNAKTEEPLAEDAQVWLKIAYDFGSSRAVFSYSLDGENWEVLGNQLVLGFSTSTTFMGTRSWLFCYATEEAGGYADFDYYSIR